MENIKNSFIRTSSSRSVRGPQGRDIGAAKGFTLIELLVVVLIIGILAAVAVPQYKKAVLKARFMELITIGDAIHKAEEVYYLANNTYADSQDKLDLEVSLPSHISMDISVSDANVVLSSTKLPSMAYVFYFDQHPTNKGVRQCRVVSDNETLKQVCKSITGREIYSVRGSYWSSNF